MHFQCLPGAIKSNLSISISNAHRLLEQTSGAIRWKSWEYKHKMINSVRFWVNSLSQLAVTKPSTTNCSSFTPAIVVSSKVLKKYKNKIAKNKINFGSSSKLEISWQHLKHDPDIALARAIYFCGHYRVPQTWNFHKVANFMPTPPPQIFASHTYTNTYCCTHTHTHWREHSHRHPIEF